MKREADKTAERLTGQDLDRIEQEVARAHPVRLPLPEPSRAPERLRVELDGSSGGLRVLFRGVDIGPAVRAVRVEMKRGQVPVVHIRASAELLLGGASLLSINGKGGVEE